MVYKIYIVIFLCIGCMWGLSIPRASAATIIQRPFYVGLVSGVIGVWTLDGMDMNATRANDASGQGNHGTLSGGPARVIGKVGQALSFDGVDDLVNLGSATILNDISPMSISMWVYARSEGEGSAGALMAKDTAASAGRWVLRFGSGTNAIEFFKDGSTDLTVQTSNNAIRLNEWHHVVLSWDGSTTATNAEIFINGTEASYQTQTNGASFVSDASLSLFIGNRSNAGTTFDGLIDDVRTYNRTLSLDEIKRLYKIGGTFTVNKSFIADPELSKGLLGYWTFDPAYMAGTSAYDASGNNKHGTLVNAMRSEGRISQGVALDGSGDYVDIGNVGSSVQTISFWVKPRTTGGTTQSYTTAGQHSFVVPADVTSISIKAWGAGGGGGGNDNATAGGGDGGGGGYSTATVSVTPSDTITVRVGAKGVGGSGVGAGGGGGGYSSATTTSTNYVIAGAGGGGGAGSAGSAENGGDGGAGGGTSGVDGGVSSDIAGAYGRQGLGGGSASGGTGGTAGTGCNGENGETDGRHHGGDAGGNGSTCGTVGSGAGGSIGGGLGGGDSDGGGGGGAGYFGGGGGESGVGEGGGGGGGGSSFTNGGSTSAGSGVTPGGSIDVDRGTYCSASGTGGTGGPAGDLPGSDGTDGCVLISYPVGTGGGLLDLDGTDYIRMADRIVTPVSISNSTVYVNGVRGATTLSVNKWNHVVITTTDTGVNASNADIGRVSANYLEGFMDDVRLYNRVLSASEINRLFKIGGTFVINKPSESSSVSDGLVGYWSFNGPELSQSSQVYVPDKSGNGNPGTISGAGLAIGKIGQGLWYDGVNDVVTMQGPSLTTDATMAGWFYWDSSDIDTASLIRDHTSSGGWILGLISGGNIVFRTAGTEFNTGVSATPYRNKWTHYAFTKSGGSVAYYLDGRLVYSSTGAANTANTAPWYIMKNGNSGGGFLKGYADEVRMYNRALSAQEIKRLYEVGR